MDKKKKTSKKKTPAEIKKEELIESKEYVDYEYVCPIRGRVRERVLMFKFKPNPPSPPQDEDLEAILSTEKEY